MDYTITIAELQQAVQAAKDQSSALATRLAEVTQEKEALEAAASQTSAPESVYDVLAQPFAIDLLMVSHSTYGEDGFGSVLSGAEEFSWAPQTVSAAEEEDEPMLRLSTPDGIVALPLNSRLTGEAKSTVDSWFEAAGGQQPNSVALIYNEAASTTLYIYITFDEGDQVVDLDLDS